MYVVQERSDDIFVGEDISIHGKRLKVIKHGTIKGV
jgi:hypothetical protein